MFLLFLAGSLKSNISALSPQDQCVDYQVVFARGSGEVVRTGVSNQAFRSAIDNMFSKIPSKTYRYYDLGESSSFGKPYPAIGVEKPEIIAGALISGGKAHSFGQSIKTGIDELKTLYREISKICPNTKFIFAGYSQGAMLINQAIRGFNPKKILYSASFGDPKLYLPEGNGIFPKACQNQQLSSYRQNIPDCYVEQGILGGLDPYIYSSFKGKVGAWCQTADFICGSTFDPFGLSDPSQSKDNDLFAHLFNGHTSYSKHQAYQEATEIIYSKIMQEQYKIPKKDQFIYYYDPNSLSSNLPLYLQKPYTKPVDQENKSFSRNELIVAFPNFSLPSLDNGRYRFFLEKIFEAAQNNNTLIHVYTYGFYKNSSDAEESSSNTPPNLQDYQDPSNYHTGVKLFADIEASHMSDIQWNELTGVLLQNRRKFSSVNISQVFESAFYDIVKITPWSQDANHLLVALTPASTFLQNYQTFPNQTMIDRIDKQNSSLHLSSFFINDNPIFLNELLRFKTVNPQNIFLKQHSPESITHQIFSTSSSTQLSQLVKPSFDSIDLTFTNDNFHISKTTSPYPKKRSRKHFLKNNSTPAQSSQYQWIIQTEKTSFITTIENHLTIPLNTLSTISVQLTTPDFKVKHATINLLPKNIPFSKTSLIKQKDSIFPYRLIILDDYLLGFTKSKKIKYHQLDKNSPHHLTFVTFSNLGRIIKRQTINLPQTSGLITDSDNQSKNPHPSSTSTTPTNLNAKNPSTITTKSSNNTHVPKVPNCGVGSKLQ